MRSERERVRTGYRLLICTDVLLDALVAERPESVEACRVLELCNGGGDMGLACSLSLKDVYYVLQKHFGTDRAWSCIDALSGLVAIVPVGAEECDVSLRKDEPDFEDGIVRACAELSGVDFILTRDAEAFGSCKIRSMTCSEYLEVVAKNEREWLAW